VLFQKTLRLPTVRRDNVKIDYLGATLIAAGVSVLLVWISFVDNAFAWASWQTAAMSVRQWFLLSVAVWVEARAAEPIVPLRIVRQRTTALAIRRKSRCRLRPCFGQRGVPRQYFQVSRGYTARWGTADRSRSCSSLIGLRRRRRSDAAQHRIVSSPRRGGRVAAADLEVLTEEHRAAEHGRTGQRDFRRLPGLWCAA